MLNINRKNCEVKTSYFCSDSSVAVIRYAVKQQISGQMQTLLARQFIYSFWAKMNSLQSDSCSQQSTKAAFPKFQTFANCCIQWLLHSFILFSLHFIHMDLSDLYSLGLSILNVSSQTTFQLFIDPSLKSHKVLKINVNSPRFCCWSSSSYLIITTITSVMQFMILQTQACSLTCHLDISIQKAYQHLSLSC